MWNKAVLGILTCICMIAVWPGQMGCDDDSKNDSSSDGDSDSDTGPDPCADYRSEYPEDPYGVTVGSILADFPGMVDGQGNSHDLFEVFQDNSKVALLIVNAFDT